MRRSMRRRSGSGRRWGGRSRRGKSVGVESGGGWVLGGVFFEVGGEGGGRMCVLVGRLGDKGLRDMLGFILGDI